MARYDTFLLHLPLSRGCTPADAIDTDTCWSYRLSPYMFPSIHMAPTNIFLTFLVTFVWLHIAVQCVFPSFYTWSLFIIIPGCYHLLPRLSFTTTCLFTTSCLVLFPWPITTYYRSHSLYFLCVVVLVSQCFIVSVLHALSRKYRGQRTPRKQSQTRQQHKLAVGGLHAQKS